MSTDITFSNSLTQFAKRNAQRFDSVPKSGPFTINSHEIGPVYVKKAEKVGMVKKLGKVQHNGYGGGKNVHVWALTDKGRAAVEDYGGFDGPMLMPCGHSGQRNIEDSDFFACTTCGGRFTRDELLDYREREKRA